MGLFPSFLFLIFCCWRIETWQISVYGPITEWTWALSSCSNRYPAVSACSEELKTALQAEEQKARLEMPQSTGQWQSGSPGLQKNMPGNTFTLDTRCIKYYSLPPLWVLRTWSVKFYLLLPFHKLVEINSPENPISPIINWTPEICPATHFRSPRGVHLEKRLKSRTA